MQCKKMVSKWQCVNSVLPWSIHIMKKLSREVLSMAQDHTPNLVNYICTLKLKIKNTIVVIHYSK